MPDDRATSYEDDLTIDETSLDVEWLDQSARMGRYCRLMAEAQRDVNLAKERLDYEVARAKEELDFVYATVERAVRGDPASYGVVAGPRGVTEDAIKAAIQVHPEYRAAFQANLDAKMAEGRAVAEARFRYDLVAGAVRSFDHRKSALENLVRLHGASYFAGPAVPRDLSEMRRDRDRDVQRTIGERMRRRRT